MINHKAHTKNIQSDRITHKTIIIKDGPKILQVKWEGQFQIE